jgi:hypothetical protein
MALKCYVQKPIYTLTSGNLKTKIQLTGFWSPLVWHMYISFFARISCVLTRFARWYICIPKIPIFGTLRTALEWNIFVWFSPIRYILQLFGIRYGHFLYYVVVLVNFFTFWLIIPRKVWQTPIPAVTWRGRWYSCTACTRWWRGCPWPSRRRIWRPAVNFEEAVFWKS